VQYVITIRRGDLPIVGLFEADRRNAGRELRPLDFIV
jgi:hypothetical protein